MWVRIPPAAPIPDPIDIECVAVPPDVTACADLRDTVDAYVYLLGMYLGDGFLTQGPRNVWKLRISLDMKYPGIIERCEWAIAKVAAKHAGRVPRTGCFEVYSNWKHWHCLFPQHGPGAKHLRTIELAPWQAALVKAYPAELVRGLIHSDGCRSLNKVWRGSGDHRKQYVYPRYFLVNHSPGIRQMFSDVCTALGVESRPNNRYSISVARRESVERLDALVGPKR
jgi:hypothetical protein